MANRPKKPRSLALNINDVLTDCRGNAFKVIFGVRGQKLCVVPGGLVHTICESPSIARRSISSNQAVNFARKANLRLVPGDELLEGVYS